MQILPSVSHARSIIRYAVIFSLSSLPLKYPAHSSPLALPVHLPEAGGGAALAAAAGVPSLALLPYTLNRVLVFIFTVCVLVSVDSSLPLNRPVEDLVRLVHPGWWGELVRASVFSAQVLFPYPNPICL